MMGFDRVIKGGSWLFGGAGVAMLAGAVALVVDGELLAGVVLGVMGSAFVFAAIMMRRLFLAPEGKKHVLVSERTGDTVTERVYAAVDEDTPDEEIERLRRERDERPWTARGDWARGTVAAEGGFGDRTVMWFAVVWNVFSWGFAALFLWDSWEPWPVLVFPLVGIVLAVVVVRARIRDRKFGRSVIACRTMPAWVGERFEGTVQTGVPTRGQATKTFQVRLACVRRSTRYERGADGKRQERVVEEVLWKHEEAVRGQISSTGPTFQVPLDLPLPDGLPGTELSPEDDRPLWRLALRAEDTGVDYAADFELPVFARRAAEAAAAAP